MPGLLRDNGLYGVLWVVVLGGGLCIAYWEVDEFGFGVNSYYSLSLLA